MAAPVCAIIVAGGTGSRFGNPGGKQLVMVEGRPLVSWCIAAFDRSELVGHIVVVCPQERRLEMARDAVEPFGYATPVTYADAGSTRQDSTRAGLDAVPEGFSYVAVHDGARPLIKPQTVDSAARILMANAEIDGVVCGQPAIDTLKRVEPDGRRAASFGRCRRRRSLRSRRFGVRLRLPIAPDSWAPTTPRWWNAPAEACSAWRARATI